MNPEPSDRDVRTKYDETPEGISPETWMCFCQDATRYDMRPDLMKREPILRAQNPWAVLKR